MSDMKKERKSALWLTTPVGMIAKAMMRFRYAPGDQFDLKSMAEQAVDDFLYDLSADGPVLVVKGDTRRVRAWSRGYHPLWEEVFEDE